MSSVFKDKNYFLVAVSDVHLGFKDHSQHEYPKEHFEKFLDELSLVNHVENFVVLGDFFDLWRRDDTDVIKEHENILLKLKEMKGKQIKNLHYLIGNHDYILPWYKWLGFMLLKSTRERRNLIKDFKFKKGSSYKPKPLELTWKNKQHSVEKKIILKHGHQDREGKWGALYDVVCMAFCSLNNETGWVASKLWKYKHFIPHLVCVVSGILALGYFINQQLLYAAIFGLVTLVSLIWVIWTIKSPEYQAKEVVKELEKIGHSRKAEADEKLQDFVITWRDVFHEISELESMRKSGQITEEEFYYKLQEILSNLAQRHEQEPSQYQIVREQYYDIKQQFIDRPVVPTPGNILIVGHTHDLLQGVPFHGNIKWNPGAWVENNRITDYNIMTVTTDGIEDMILWTP